MAGLSASYPQYATSTDLDAYVGSAVPQADQRLQQASGQIRDWTKTAHYAVGADGYTPTLQVLAEALHDAAILQAAALYRAGIAPGDTGAVEGKQIQSKTLGGRSVTYAPDATAAQARAALLEGALAPEATAVLRSRGLINSNVYTGGYADYDILARQWVIA